MFGTVDLSVNSPLKAIIGFVFILVLTSACNQSKGSGECYYDRVDTTAEVIDLRKSSDDEGRVEVILDFKASTLAFEDQEMGALKDIRIDQDFVDRNRIRLGNQYNVIVSEITQGDCTPMIVSFEHSLE